MQLSRRLSELEEMSLLQVEPKTLEPYLHQIDVSSLRPDGGVPATGKDLHQQSIQLQRMPPKVFLQQRPLPKLLGSSSEQEIMEIAREKATKAFEPNLQF